MARSNKSSAPSNNPEPADVFYSVASIFPSLRTCKAKAGLAWSDQNNSVITQFMGPEGYYTWGPQGYFVPMLWGTKQINSFQQTIDDNILTLNITTVLGMNEPQEPSQSNLSPAEGAEMWKEYLEPLRARKIRLGSPAPSGSSNSIPCAEETVQWIFWLYVRITGKNTSRSLRLPFSDWYNTNATAFKEFIVDFHEKFNLNIWVTEWACQNMSGPDDQCTLPEIVDFLRETQTFMDQTDWVERYAWYGVKRDMNGVNQEDAMMDPDGVINALGKQYISE
ncbi:hypothetical protein B0H14DRAFT_3106460 [Mycena olivaceomarginata]|nr:hypothetical protein B0H14DRAFT_3106460 [Mycena olivaceomarginata]